MPRTEKTLDRLVSMGRCSCQNVEDYSEQLKNLAAEKATRAEAKKRSKFFKALADETRQRMISLLLERELCVCEMMTALNIPQPTVSHHLGILDNVQLIQGRKEGRWVFYEVPDKKWVSGLLNMVK